MKNKFSKFKDKIIYVPVEDMPNGKNPYLRENFQRNCITRGLKNSAEDDLIIISDLDEIPNPNQILKFKPKLKYAAFQQMHFYYKFNLSNKPVLKYYGTSNSVNKYLKSPQWLKKFKI